MCYCSFLCRLFILISISWVWGQIVFLWYSIVLSCDFCSLWFLFVEFECCCKVISFSRDVLLFFLSVRYDLFVEFESCCKGQIIFSWCVIVFFLWLLFVVVSIRWVWLLLLLRSNCFSWCSYCSLYLLVIFDLLENK